MEDIAAVLEPVIGPHLHEGPDIELVRRRAARHRRRHRSQVAVSAIVVVGVALASVALVRGEGSSTSPEISPASPTDASAATTPPPPDLPEFQHIELPSGRIGYVESKLINELPPTDPTNGAAFSAWLHTLVPVTAEPNSSSQLLGYVIRNYGPVDLATVQAPGFDIETYLSEAAAKNQREVDALQGYLATTTTLPPTSRP